LENYDQQISKPMAKEESHEDSASPLKPRSRENAVIKEENRSFGEDLD
jgi:hypothetical protein